MTGDFLPLAQEGSVNAPEKLLFQNEAVAEPAKRPITVIIPTYNRQETLEICLKRLENQTFTDFSIIIVDDGSTDATLSMVEEYCRNTRLHITVLQQANSGPARARNLAIREAQSPICILIGDDILASPAFVERHLRLHREHPEIDIVGLGLTRWDESLQEITPFMMWLEHIQFGYDDLVAGTIPDWRHFYTSNLSFKTALLQAEPFDERFRKAAFEDIELGYRLTNKGHLKMAFLPDAFATHVHPTSLLDGCRRMRTVGYSAHQFASYWPDAKGIALSGSWLKRSLFDFYATFPAVVQWTASAIYQIQGNRSVGRVARFLLRSHYAIGYREFREE
jgi:glycosyltransferase involved in cell wall biosynthesis